MGSASLLIQTNPVSLSIIFAECCNHVLGSGTEFDFDNLDNLEQASISVGVSPTLR